MASAPSPASRMIITPADSPTRVVSRGYVRGRVVLGRITPGAAADPVWPGPDHRARTTWVNGQKVFGGGS